MTGHTTKAFTERTRTMKKSLLLGAFLVLGAAVSASTAHAADPVQTNLINSTFRGVATPARYLTLAQSMWELSPGGASAPTATTYARFFTVTAGEMTATIGDKTAVYGAGTNFNIPPGIIARVTNESRTATARFVAASLLTAWATPAVPGSVTTLGEAPNPPRQLSVASTPVANAAPTVDLIHWIVDYDPGFRTPNHVMNHPHVFTIVSGEITFGYLDGTVERFRAGQTAVMTPGRPGYMANETTEKATYQITWLQTPGTALTSPAPAPAAAAAATTGIRPPSTGDGGLAAGSTSSFPAPALLLLAGASAAGAGLLGGWARAQPASPHRRR